MDYRQLIAAISAFAFGISNASGQQSIPSVSQQLTNSTNTTERWTHNGSTMRLEADGTIRRFVYERPTTLGLDPGAQVGNLVIDGNSDGFTFKGTAYLVDKRCGAFPYEVQGPITHTGRRVEMRGNAPLVGYDCAVFGYRFERLVFTLAP